MSDHLPAYLTVQEASDLTRLSVGNLNRRRCLRMGPPYLKIGMLVRYDRKAVEKWLSQQTVDTRD